MQPHGIDFPARLLFNKGKGNGSDVKESVVFLMLTKAMKELLEKTGKLSTRGIENVDGLLEELRAAGFEASLDSGGEWITVPQPQAKKTCYSHW